VLLVTLGLLVLSLRTSALPPDPEDDAVSAGSATEADPEAQSDGWDRILPAHEFRFKQTLGQSGKFKGVTRIFVTLSAPPYDFRRKVKSLGDGHEVFICSGCDSLGRTVKATAFKTLRDPKDEMQDTYQLFNHLIPDPEDHVCALSHC
jgi:hypothetical protein